VYVESADAGHEITQDYKVAIQKHLYEQNAKFDSKPTGWTDPSTDVAPAAGDGKTKPAGGS